LKANTVGLTIVTNAKTTCSGRHRVGVFKFIKFQKLLEAEVGQVTVDKFFSQNQQP